MSQPTRQSDSGISYEAYNRNLPCLNPACKSHGQPHPSCRCYGMAEGGEAGHYCSQARAHEPICMYYMAEGGQALPMQPRASRTPQTGNTDQAMAALAHGGASMLFGSPKSPFFSAFGSGSNRLQALIKPKDELDNNISNYLAKAKKGSSHIDDGVESLFGGSKLEHAPITDKEDQQIRDYVEQGGLGRELQNQDNPPTQMFAEGGSVTHAKREDPLSSVFPDHNVLLNAAKARVLSHLNSVRPQSIQTKLPFDSDKPNKAQNREYDKAVKLAARPLSILDHVRDGNLTPNTLKHFNSLYPELHDHLSKKITERVTQAQLNGEKPKYKTRQAMSLLMGAALDSTMTPPSIVSAQGTFAQKQAQQQPPQGASKPKKNKSSLDKASENFATGDQAAAARQKQ